MRATGLLPKMFADACARAEAINAENAFCGDVNNLRIKSAPLGSDEGREGERVLE